MKKIHFLIFLVLSLLFVLQTNAFAQNDKVRASLKASATQRLGVDTDITFDFSRPGVKERTIWGELVPYGLEPGNKYSDGKDYPWRGGANENSTIECSKDILIEGNKLPAGKYSLHFIPSEDEWQIMFNTVNDKWGSYQYDASKDVFQITVKPLEAPHQEWLIYGFDDLAGTSATAFLHWEKLKVPFKITLPE